MGPSGPAALRRAQPARRRSPTRRRYRISVHSFSQTVQWRPKAGPEGRAGGWVGQRVLLSGGGAFFRRPLRPACAQQQHAPQRQAEVRAAAMGGAYRWRLRARLRAGAPRGRRGALGVRARQPAGRARRAGRVAERDGILQGLHRGGARRHGRGQLPRRGLLGALRSGERRALIRLPAEQPGIEGGTPFVERRAAAAAVDGRRGLRVRGQPAAAPAARNIGVGVGAACATARTNARTPSKPSWRRGGAGPVRRFRSPSAVFSTVPRRSLSTSRPRLNALWKSCKHGSECARYRVARRSPAESAPSRAAAAARAAG
jgi:hypothetical protein